MMMNEIPMDSLMALAAERRARYTADAERFRLGRDGQDAARHGRARWFVRDRWFGRRRPRADATRVPAAEPDPCL